MVAGLLPIVAQNLPERGEIRRGNRLFDKERWEEAAERYTKALTYSPASFEANYNLSNALHKSQEFATAEELMAKVAADSLLDAQSRADAYFNLGNSQFHQQKYEEALESYKSSIRLNHTDSTAKYNYAYTKLMLQQQEQENQDNQDQDNQDQNQDNQEQNQDQNQEQNQDNQEQNQDNQEQENQEQEQEQNPQPQDGELSEQQLEQILDAIQAQEDKTQEKLDKEKGRAILIPNSKNW